MREFRARESSKEKEMLAREKGKGRAYQGRSHSEKGQWPGEGMTLGSKKSQQA